MQFAPFDIQIPEPIMSIDPSGKEQNLNEKANEKKKIIFCAFTTKLVNIKIPKNIQ